MQRSLVIDGYNAISKIKELDAKKDISLKAARLYFIKILSEFVERKRLFNKVVIVFDSKDREEWGLEKHSYGDVEVVFTTKDRDADSVIVDMLKNASSKDKMTVSSDDNFIRNHARAFGNEVLSIEELKNIIMLKKGSFGSKIKEQNLESSKLRDINEELKKHWNLK